jgi:hypothetical protein
MKLLLLAIPAILLLCPSCSVSATAQAGYTSMAFGGNIGLAPTSGSSGVAVSQSVDSALGLGQQSGSPYGRVQVELGVPVITLSAFKFHDEGTGHLQGQFGNISGGTDVVSNLDFTNLKGSFAFAVDLGLFKLAPGLAVDLFDIDMRVHDVAGFAEEDFKVLAPVPMAFLRGETDLFSTTLVGEVGYMTIPKINDIKGTFWDAEAMLEVHPMPLFHLFAGYRYISISGQGTVDNQDFNTDLNIRGWQIGGGVRF